MQGRNLTWFVTRVICCFLLTACAHDTYQQRADVIKDHTEAFYTHLKANRVEAAIRENEQIEAMASDMGRTVRKRASLQGATPVEREFALMKTAKEAAATNWLALGPIDSSNFDSGHSTTVTNGNMNSLAAIAASGELT